MRSSSDSLFLSQYSVRGAGGVLHHEVRLAAVGGPGLEHPSDGVVVHHRQGLTLHLEASDHSGAVHAELDHLHRDAAADRFLLLGEVDRAHPALAQGVEDGVRADPGRLRGLLWRNPGKRRSEPDVIIRVLLAQGIQRCAAFGL